MTNGVFMYLSRLLSPPTRSFFLLGPRGTGKSTWLKQVYPGALHIDLLRNDVYFALASSPAHFRARVLAVDPKKTWIIVDEIQRLPILLNDVHSLIEDHGYRFALSGSSARKLKCNKANLLAGRAIVKHLYPLVFAELGDVVTLDEALQFGTLPSAVMDKASRIDYLESYVGTYLREEIREEALTRNVNAFGRFLEVAALMHGQGVNLSNIARDAGVSRNTVTTYFDILTDTLLGAWLPAWRPKAKVKEVAHPKFYFFDNGVVRAIQKNLRELLGGSERGVLFETTVFNELNARIAYSDDGGELFYWRTPEGSEVDFIWKRGQRVVAIEVKSSARWRDEFNVGFKSLLNSSVKVNACYGVYLGDEVLKKEFGFVYPWPVFLEKLGAGEII
ncbi:MAG TPA: ATP-binding protein [Gammaproteobacteria bacterium]|jgi:predicted AAA+ superfamily ATPase|nr:ATP-binding protein [Gammaproteobacteria bacterium]